MNFKAVVFLALAWPVFCHGQATARDISPSQLQAVLDLRLDQAVKLRETYKAPLKSAYKRQTSMTGNDCQAEIKWQQPYNVCMGQATVRADEDYAIFFNNLQMLCHDQNQLTTLQAFEKVWQMYKDGAMKATHAAWPEGTGAAGFAGQVYLSLVRDHMRELEEIYGLNIAQ
jgi:cytochrome c551/c552